MNKKFIALLLLIIAIIFGTPLFFIIYRETVSFYVEEDYDHFSRVIFIPIIIFLALIVAYKSIKSDLKRDTFSIKEYLKQLPYFIVGFAGLYFFIGWFFSAMLLFLNMHLMTPQDYVIHGRVTDKHVYRGKGASYQLTVFNDNDGKTYKFDTTWREIDKYNMNGRFDKKMKKGFFGFVYAP